MMDIRISAVIPTFNRANYLRKAITSLANQSLPRQEYEILVIDNASTDNTKEVVLKEFGGLTNIRYIFEPIIGLSQARNTGWRNAQGKYVAFLDDDAVASPEWLKNILDVFQPLKPQPGCIGGRVEPIWEALQPSWLPREMTTLLSLLDWSDKPLVLDKKKWLVGANIAFPKYILELLRGFNTGLDRKGNNLLSMGDVCFQQELIRKGYHCLYHPDIVVYHHIPSYRLTKRWFFRRSYCNGISSARVRFYRDAPSFLKRILMAAREAATALISLPGVFNCRRLGIEKNIFKYQCYIFSKLGHIFTLLNLVRPDAKIVRQASY